MTKARQKFGHQAGVWTVLTLRPRRPCSSDSRRHRGSRRIRALPLTSTDFRLQMSIETVAALVQLGASRTQPGRNKRGENLGSLAPILPYSAPGCSPCAKSGDAANQRRLGSVTPTNIANQNAASSCRGTCHHPLCRQGRIGGNRQTRARLNGT